MGTWRLRAVAAILIVTDVGLGALCADRNEVIDR